MILDYPGGPSVITLVLVGGPQKKSVRGEGDVLKKVQVRVTSLAEGGRPPAASRAIWEPLEDGKGKDVNFPPSL